MKFLLFLPLLVLGILADPPVCCSMEVIGSRIDRSPRMAQCSQQTTFTCYSANKGHGVAPQIVINGQKTIASADPGKDAVADLTCDQKSAKWKTSSGDLINTIECK